MFESLRVWCFFLTFVLRRRCKWPRSLLRGKTLLPLLSVFLKRSRKCPSGWCCFHSGSCLTLVFQLCWRLRTRLTFNSFIKEQAFSSSLNICVCVYLHPHRTNSDSALHTSVMNPPTGDPFTTGCPTLTPQNTRRTGEKQKRQGWQLVLKSILNNYFGNTIMEVFFSAKFYSNHTQVTGSLFSSTVFKIKYKNMYILYYFYSDLILYAFLLEFPQK